MQTTETNNLIRWILIIPGTLGAAALGLACHNGYYLGRCQLLYCPFASADYCMGILDYR